LMPTSRDEVCLQNSEGVWWRMARRVPGQSEQSRGSQVIGCRLVQWPANTNKVTLTAPPSGGQEGMAPFLTLTWMPHPGALPWAGECQEKTVLESPRSHAVFLKPDHGTVLYSIKEEKGAQPRPGVPGFLATFSWAWTLLLSRPPLCGIALKPTLGARLAQNQPAILALSRPLW
jgi:hypothetical protein